MEAPNVLLSNIQLVSGILFVALFFVAGAASSVVAVAARRQFVRPDDG